MGRNFVEEVRSRLDPQPDMTQLIGYDEAAQRYWPRFVAIGLGGKHPEDEEAARTSVASTLRSLRARKVIRGWIVGYTTRLYPGDIETYLNVVGEPRPIA